MAKIEAPRPDYIAGFRPPFIIRKQNYRRLHKVKKDPHFWLLKAEAISEQRYRKEAADSAARISAKYNK